ncbi:MAG: hypothetical protein ACRDXX_13105 [Stackebrandtia sp.]
MNEDVKNLLDRALPDSWDAVGAGCDDAIAQGGKIRRRRRLAAGSGVTFGVAAIAVAAVALVPGPQPSGKDDSPAPAASGSKESKADYYQFGKEVREDDPSAGPYTEALTSYLEVNHPEVLKEMDDMGFGDYGFGWYTHDVWLDSDGDMVDGEIPGNADDNGAEPDADDELVASYPRLSAVIDGFDDYDTGQSTIGDPDVSAKIDVEVIPDGADPWFDGADREDLCADYVADEEADGGVNVTVECEEAQGPKGEPVTRLREAFVETDGATIDRVLLHRDDGSRVLASILYSWDGDDPDKGDLEPYLGFDELTGMAAALPTDKIATE